MESARLQSKLKENDSLSRKDQSVRTSSTSTSRWPITFKDTRPPSLRMGSVGTGIANSMQAKLTINTPGDLYEQEADRVAEQVMRMPDTAPRLQRKCGCGSRSSEDCAECSRQPLRVQRQTTSASPATAGVPAIVQDVLRAPGHELDRGTREFFERRFGRDLSSVRVHTDGQAAESAQAVNAFAYTVGPNLVFASGRYAPQTEGGRHLIAHELAHAVQQGAAVTPLVDSERGVQRHNLFPEPGGDGEGARNANLSPTSGAQSSRLNQVAPMIQRDGPDVGTTSQVGTLNLRVGEDGRIEFTYGAPNAPAVGPLGLGFRCQGDGCRLVFGQDPSQIGNRTYTLQEALDLLKGFGQGAPGGGGPPSLRGLPGGPTAPGLSGPVIPSQSSGICLRWSLAGRCQLSIPISAPGRSSTVALPQISSGLRFTLEQSRIIDHFALDRDTLPAGAGPTLDSLATTLYLNQEGDVYIEGHTDSSATPGHNQPLSERRAANVRDALVSRGVSAARIHVQGFGETRLRYPEEHDGEEKALNRRVEVRYRVPIPEQLASTLRPPPSLRMR